MPVLKMMSVESTNCYTVWDFSQSLSLISAKSRGKQVGVGRVEWKIWIRRMSEGLVWQLLIPLLQERSRSHLDTFVSFCSIHILRGFENTRAQLDTFAVELMGWDAISLNKSISICNVFPLIRPPLAWSVCEEKRCITGLIKDTFFFFSDHLFRLVRFERRGTCVRVFEGRECVALFQNI